MHMEFCLETYMMAVAVERRRGNLDAAEEIYCGCLSKFKDKENKSWYSSIVIKYARFLTYVSISWSFLIFLRNWEICAEEIRGFGRC